MPTQVPATSEASASSQPSKGCGKGSRPRGLTGDHIPSAPLPHRADTKAHSVKVTRDDQGQDHISTPVPEAPEVDHNAGTAHASTETKKKKKKGGKRVKGEEKMSIKDKGFRALLITQCKLSLNSAHDCRNFAGCLLYHFIQSLCAFRRPKLKSSFMFLSFPCFLVCGVVLVSLVPFGPSWPQVVRKLSAVGPKLGPN